MKKIMQINNNITNGLNDIGLSGGIGNNENSKGLQRFLIERKDQHKDLFKTTEDRWALPGWTYHNMQLLEMEKKHIYRTHWLLVCHVNNLKKPGDYITDKLLGDRILVLRGNDNEVRVFYNLCRHRGSTVVDNSEGNCGRIITCPFHGWTYHLDGSLMGVAQPGAYENIDKKKFGLRQVETEIWKGFIFIRFEKGPQPSVAELMAPYEELFSHYNMENLKPANTGDNYGSEEINANWKSSRDVDNEGYHVALVHTYLVDLYGRDYSEDYFTNWTSLARGPFTKGRDHTTWSVRAYRKALERLDNLDEIVKNTWFYVGLWPGNVFQLYPESVNFYQDLPIRPDLTRQRYGYYTIPTNDKKSTKYIDLAAKLARRIDKFTYDEDRMLTLWSFEGQSSKAFPGAFLSNFEPNVKAYHNLLQKYLPVMTLPNEPIGQDIEALNRQLLTRLQNK